LMSPPGAPQEQIDATREQLGLSDPLVVQYVRFLGEAARGDFGDSYHWRDDAMTVVLDALPATLLLAASATLFAVVVGVSLGMLAAFRHHRIVDRVLSPGRVTG